MSSESLLKGNNILLSGGGWFDLAEPNLYDVEVSDIALSLSRQCRYTGHGSIFYSVAQHCVNCVNIARGLGVSDKEDLRFVLFHDAAEAYCGDVAKPLKIMLDSYGEIEGRCMEAIQHALRLTPFDGYKQVDLIAYKAEMRVLFGNEFVRNFPEISNFELAYPDEMLPKEAEQLFLDVAEGLSHA